MLKSCSQFGLVSAFTSIGVLTTSIAAQALSVSWSFENVTGNTSGVVAGTIDNLTDNATTLGNTAIVTVLVSPNNAGLGTYSFTSGTGFTVTNGQLTFADWIGAQGNFTLSLGTDGGTTASPELFAVDTSTFVADNRLGASIASPSAVPIPAPFAATGFLPVVLNLGIRTLKRHRKPSSSTIA